MAGAYVARPATPVVPPDVPPDWNPDWTFPGPSPPGYEPEYSLPIAAPASVVPGNSLATSVRLRDHATYRTTQPVAPSVLTWTATVDNVPVPLRFAGAPNCATSVVSVYADFDGFWGADPTLDVQLTESHNGKTLVLRATSLVGKETVVGTKSVSVETPPRVVTLTLGWSAGTGIWSTQLSISRGGSGFANRGYSSATSDYFGTNNYPDEVTITDGNPISFSLSELVMGELLVNVPYTSLFGGAVATATLTISGGGLPGGTWTTTRSGTTGPSTWLTINCDTWEVTVLNP